MDKEQQEIKNNLPGKKEMKKQLADKIETALPELREMLGEKKFVNRLKKAAKLLMEGLHKEDIPKKNKQAIKKVSTKKAAPKQAAVKQPSAKQAAVKTASVKKAAAKKRSAGK